MIICGTGHRPPKLGGYSDEVFDKLVSFAKNMLRKHFRYHLSTSYGPMTVISGLALGWDQALALAASNLGLTVWGYAPCRNMDSKWPQWSKDKFELVCGRLDKIVYIHDGDYLGAWCNIKRDHAMVDDSEEVLALWNGDTYRSGTYHTVSYAQKKGKKVTNVWEEWLAYERASY
jgi:uncharacterized phage-like protein YoqJ